MLVLFYDTMSSSVKKSAVEVLKDQAKERLAKRPDIDLCDFNGNNKILEQFLTINIQTLEYVLLLSVRIPTYLERKW